MRLTISHPENNATRSGDASLPSSHAGVPEHMAPEDRGHDAIPLLLTEKNEKGASDNVRQDRLVNQFQKFLERGRQQGVFVWEAGELEARFNRHIRGRLKSALASAGIQNFESLLLRCRHEGWLAIFSAGKKLYTYVRGASRNGNGGGK